MTKLKTLKDFMGWDVEINNEELGKHLSVYELRQEAIKHYVMEISEYEEHKQYSWAETYKIRADWIRYFFNITDEDLK